VPNFTIIVTSIRVTILCIVTVLATFVALNVWVAHPTSSPRTASSSAPILVVGMFSLYFLSASTSATATVSSTSPTSSSALSFLSIKRLFLLEICLCLECLAKVVFLRLSSSLFIRFQGPNKLIHREFWEVFGFLYGTQCCQSKLSMTSKFSPQLGLQAMTPHSCRVGLPQSPPEIWTWLPLCSPSSATSQTLLWELEVKPVSHGHLPYMLSPRSSTPLLKS